MRAKYICIEGNLGAGKTTLAKALANKLESHLILETFRNNPFLKDLYADKIESKFPAEVFFLMERFEQLSPEIFDNNDLIIADYLIDKTSLFAAINLEEKEIKLFQRIFSTVKNQITTPHALVYIEQSPEEAFKHVRSRGRKLEAEVSLEYLTFVNNQYLKLLGRSKTDFPIIKVTASELRSDFDDTINKIIDFLSNERLLLAKNQVKLTI